MTEYLKSVKISVIDTQQSTFYNVIIKHKVRAS